MTSRSKEIAKKAISIIEEYGWAQDTYGSTTHGFCSIGALGEAVERLGYSQVDYVIVVKRHPWGRIHGTTAIVEKNDRSSTTKEMVLKALKEIE